jgi:hypothetical protein
MVEIGVDASALDAPPGVKECILIIAENCEK